MDINLIQYVQAISSDLFHFLLGVTISWFITMRYHKEALKTRHEALEAKQKALEDTLIAKKEAMAEVFKAKEELIKAKEEQIQHLKKLIEAGDKDLAWYQREYPLLQQRVFNLPLT